eukprot:scaffold2904_cov173-Amphora_coffeaeformis.AAC.9
MRNNEKEDFHRSYRRFFVVSLQTASSSNGRVSKVTLGTPLVNKQSPTPTLGHPKDPFPQRISVTINTTKTVTTKYFPHQIMLSKPFLFHKSPAWTEESEEAPLPDAAETQFPTIGRLPRSISILMCTILNHDMCLLRDCRVGLLEAVQRRTAKYRVTVDISFASLSPLFPSDVTR